MAPDVGIPMSPDEVARMLAARVVAWLESSGNHFDNRHNEIASLVTDGVKLVADRLDDLKGDVRQLERRISEIEDNTGGYREITKAIYAETEPATSAARSRRPGRKAPRPTAIDRACAANPAGDAKRVDLPSHGLVIYPEPGADPAGVWPNAIDAFNRKA